MLVTDFSHAFFPLRECVSTPKIWSPSITVRTPFESTHMISPSPIWYEKINSSVINIPNNVQPFISLGVLDDIFVLFSWIARIFHCHALSIFFEKLTSPSLWRNVVRFSNCPRYSFKYSLTTSWNTFVAEIAPVLL